MPLILLMILGGTALPAGAAEAARPAGGGKTPVSILWDKYAARVATEAGAPATPGRLPVNAPAAERALFRADWAYREHCYEIFYAEQRVLARAVFLLAVHAGDVDKSMSLERFSGAVQGFHYSTAQICEWLNQLEQDLPVLPELMSDAVAFSQSTAGENVAGVPPSGEPALLLINWLVRDGVLTKTGTVWRPAGNVGHVLGAARGKYRSLARNLAHERAHVIWDEDAALRRRYEAAWAALSSEGRAAVGRSLPGYSRRPDVLRKEWAVRQEENILLGAPAAVSRPHTP